MTETKRIAGNLIILQPQYLAAKNPSIPFYFGVNIIGRKQECTLRITDLSVSSNHAVLTVTPKSITISDKNSRNGVKINSEENKIDQGVEIAIDGGMIVYLGDVKCKFERLDAVQLGDQTMPSRMEKKKNGKYEEFKNLLVHEDEEVDQKDLQETNKESLGRNARQEMDQFSISDNFESVDKKVLGKGASKKDTKKNAKVIIQEREEEAKEEKKIEKNREDAKEAKNQKKKQAKKDNPDRKSNKRNEDSNIPTSKNVSKGEEKQKAKGGKEQKQTANNQIIKKTDENQDIKSNISKEKQEKKKTSKDKEKKNEIKETQKPKDRKTEKQQKKVKSLPKQIAKQKQPQQIKKDRKKSLHQTVQQTRQQSQQKNQKRQSPTKTNKQAKVSEGEKTKRRTQNRKRFPSQLIYSEEQLPARRSFMNKKIMASGFILNLTKKFFWVVENAQDGFDYLIMQEYKRTYKALFAICHGIPIVKDEWVRDSEGFGRTLKPERYYFKDIDYVYKAIESVKEGHRIFKGLEFFLGSDEYHLKAADIEMLVYSCGGEIMRKVGKLSAKEREANDKVAIVRNREASTSKAYEEEVRAAKKMGFDSVYTIEFLLDSCERQVIDWKSNVARPQ